MEEWTVEYILIKYNDVKILIESECDIENLCRFLPDIQDLNQRTKKFFGSLDARTDEEVDFLKEKPKQIINNLGFNIIGTPFDLHDAELYALDRKLDYTTLELRD